MPPSRKNVSHPRRWGKLRLFRIVVSACVLVILFLCFTDFRQAIPNEWGHSLAEIQFIPALQSSLAGELVPSLVILGILLLGTLLFGRVYCSFICPLGIFQDLTARIARLVKGKKHKPLRYAPPVKWVRYIILGVVGLAFISGTQAWVISWLDPYSQFGRMANMFFNPLLIEGNNLLGHISDFFYPVRAEWPMNSGWLLVPVIGLLLLVVVLSVIRGRLYCNTVCPVGALLGLLSRFAAFRVAFDENACTKCAQCMKACKAQCIDLKKSRIDYSRCVNCFDCTPVCKEKGLRYRFAWKKKTADEIPAPAPSADRPSSLASTPPSANVMDLLPAANRRTFLGLSLLGIGATLSGCKKQPLTLQETRSHSVSKAISPPGSKNVSRFLDYCTACHLCLDACPTKTLKPAYMEYGAKGFLKPHLTFEDGFCGFDCTACADVCPAGAILPLPLEQKKRTRIGRAQFTQTQCIVALDKTSCGACSEHCPTQALAMVPMGDVVQQPAWNSDYCARCGECFKACKYGAITRQPDPTYPDKLRPVFNLDKCTGCGKCRSACEAGALTPKPAQYNLTIPRLDTTLCIGCGACEYACPVKAVIVQGVPAHETADIKQEEKVTNPNEGSDFPF